MNRQTEIANFWRLGPDGVDHPTEINQTLGMSYGIISTAGGCDHATMTADALPRKLTISVHKVHRNEDNYETG